MPSTSFRKLRERAAYRSDLLEVVVATFEGPNGTQFERDIVHHPGAVVVAPYDEATGEVIFVRQYRAPLDVELLELPAGKRDVPDEPAENTAARELAEEVGMVAGRMDVLGDFFTSPGFCDEKISCFLARDLAHVPHERHGIEEENMTLERYPLSLCEELVRSGQIMDGKTIVSLFLARAVLG